MSTAAHQRADEVLQSILSSCVSIQRALVNQTDCAKGIVKHLEEIDNSLAEVVEDFET